MIYNTIEQRRELLHKIWAQAKEEHAKAEHARTVLRRYSLWQRLTAWSLLRPIRKIIKQAEGARFMHVSMALSLMRGIRATERKMRAQQYGKEGDSA